MPAEKRISSKQKVKLGWSRVMARATYLSPWGVHIGGVVELQLIEMDDKMDEYTQVMVPMSTSEAEQRGEIVSVVAFDGAALGHDHLGQRDVPFPRHMAHSPMWVPIPLVRRRRATRH
jgi:hypothetical protein